MSYIGNVSDRDASPHVGPESHLAGNSVDVAHLEWTDMI